MSERGTTGTVNRRHLLLGRAVRDGKVPRGCDQRSKQHAPGAPAAAARARRLRRWLKFRLTTRPYWSKRARRGAGTSMSVRAASLAVVLGAIVLGGASAVELIPAAAPPARVATDFPLAS